MTDPNKTLKQIADTIGPDGVAAVTASSDKSDLLPTITERGPWRTGSNRKEWFVESDDFTHDVRLTVSGDFESDEQRWAYVREIAKRLNAYSG